MRLFDERIEALADPIDPGFGFDLIRLAVPRAEPLAPTQLELEGGAVSDGELLALIDRLSTRLGRAPRPRLAPRDTHIPEQAVLALPAIEAPAPEPWPTPPSPASRRCARSICSIRRSRSRSLAAVSRRPAAPLSLAAHARTTSPATKGPERIAAEWWRRDDNAGLTRDYYRVEDARGRRFWVFRHGLYREKAAPRWYMHGLFA